MFSQSHLEQKAAFPQQSVQPRLCCLHLMKGDPSSKGGGLLLITFSPCTWSQAASPYFFSNTKILSVLVIPLPSKFVYSYLKLLNVLGSDCVLLQQPLDREIQISRLLFHQTAEAER